MQLTHVFVFVATVVASVNALATPVHGVRMSHRHSTIAKARAPAPEAAISSPFASKRGLKKRCKPRTSTSSLVLPSGIANAGNAPVTSSVEATSAPAPAPTSEAPAPAPTTSSKTKAAPTTSEAPAPAPTSEAPAPAPTTSSKTKAAPTTTQAPAPPPTSEAPAPAPTTSSKTKAAPTTTQAPTSEAPAPAPTTSSKKPTSSSQAPQTTQASSGGVISGLGQFAGTLSGQGTWYDTGLTACGVTNNDSEFIAAVSHLMFDTFPGYAGTNPNNNPICGRKAQVTYQGKTITVTITDRCTACALEDLDFTPTAFQQLAPLGAGRISGVSWHFIS